MSDVTDVTSIFSGARVSFPQVSAPVTADLSIVTFFPTSAASSDSIRVHPLPSAHNSLALSAARLLDNSPPPLAALLRRAVAFPSLNFLTPRLVSMVPKPFRSLLPRPRVFPDAPVLLTAYSHADGLLAFVPNGQPVNSASVVCVTTLSGTPMPLASAHHLSPSALLWLPATVASVPTLAVGVRGGVVLWSFATAPSITQPTNPTFIPLAAFAPSLPVTALAASSPAFGALVAASSASRRVVVIRTSSLRARKPSCVELTQPAPVVAVRFSAHGDMLAIATAAATVRAYLAPFTHYLDVLLPATAQALVWVPNHSSPALAVACRGEDVIRLLPLPSSHLASPPSTPPPVSLAEAAVSTPPVTVGGAVLDMAWAPSAGLLVHCSSSGGECIVRFAAAVATSVASELLLAPVAATVPTVTGRDGPALTLVASTPTRAIVLAGNQVHDVAI
jgi:hypothetical protein